MAVIPMTRSKDPVWEGKLDKARKKVKEKMKIAQSYSIHSQAMPKVFGSQLLIPHVEGWSLWSAQGEQSLLWADPHVDLAWMNAHNLWVAREKVLEWIELDESAQIRALRWSKVFSDPITGVLGVSYQPFVFVTTRGQEDALWIADAKQSKVFLMKNLYLNLNTQAAAWIYGMLTYGGGVQSSEVRWVWAEDRSWWIKIQHQRGVKAVGRNGNGDLLVSMDRGGEILIWNGQKRHPHVIERWKIEEHKALGRKIYGISVEAKQGVIWCNAKGLWKRSWDRTKVDYLGKWNKAPVWIGEKFIGVADEKNYFILKNL